MWSRRWPRRATRPRRKRPELRSSYRCNARDGNARSARPPRGEQLPRLVQTIGAEAGAEQSALAQVVLRAAAANAFAFCHERGERLDRSGKILAFEGEKTPRQ